MLTHVHPARPRVRRAVAALAIGLGLGCSPALAQQAPGGVPAVPPKLEPPAGFVLFYKAHAIGTQNYECVPTASGLAWKFFAPQATLFQTLWGDITQQVATHFLSANPDESGLARATWQHSIDSSRVWARMQEFSTDAAFVEAGAIPWFLLIRVGDEPGPTGGTFLAQAAYIQRLNTSGGVAPAAGCGAPSDVGAIVLVPYSADYFFYKAAVRPR